MTTREAAYAALLAILILTAGFTWLFGPYGLLGGGLTLLVASFLGRTEDDEEEEDG